MSQPIELREGLEVDTTIGRGTALFFKSEISRNVWTVAMHGSRALIDFQQTELRVARQYTLKWDITPEDLADLTSK